MKRLSFPGRDRNQSDRDGQTDFGTEGNPQKLIKTRGDHTAGSLEMTGSPKADVVRLSSSFVEH